MDGELARRCERAEGAIGASFVEVRRRLSPQAGAAWHDYAGTYAIFDGATSPMSQSFGLGLFAPVTPELLDSIEAFFLERGGIPMHEVSPFAGVEAFALLVDRGYRPIDLSTVLVRPLAEIDDPTPIPGLVARAMTGADRAVWIETAVRGWSSEPETAQIIRDLSEGVVENPVMTNFLVERAGVPIATGSLGMHAGVALAAGASTIPEGRGLGAQGLLLASRLAEARGRGCDVALMLATPGSTSQRNAERRGFRVAYTRTKWQLASGDGGAAPAAPA